MAYRSILSAIAKGDFENHPFRGNQYRDANGNPRQTVGGNKQFRSLRGDEIDGKPTEFSVSGNQKVFAGKALMKSGEVAFVKQVGSWTSPKGTKYTAEDLVRREMLASKIGAAVDAPIRSATLLKGTTDTLLHPFIEGKTPFLMGCKNPFPFESPTTIANYPPKVRQQVADAQFFNALVGNGDTHWKNWMVSSRDSWDNNPFTDSTTVTSIDHSLAFVQHVDSYTLQAEAKYWSIPDERIVSITKGVDGLLAGGKLDPWETAQVSSISKNLHDGFPQLLGS